MPHPVRGMPTQCARKTAKPIAIGATLAPDGAKPALMVPLARGVAMLWTLTAVSHTTNIRRKVPIISNVAAEP